MTSYDETFYDGDEYNGYYCDQADSESFEDNNIHVRIARTQPRIPNGGVAFDIMSEKTMIHIV